MLDAVLCQVYWMLTRQMPTFPDLKMEGFFFLQDPLPHPSSHAFRYVRLAVAKVSCGHLWTGKLIGWSCKNVKLVSPIL
jgi:hypothetical protein